MNKLLIGIILLVCVIECKAEFKIHTATGLFTDYTQNYFILVDYVFVSDGLSSPYKSFFFHKPNTKNKHIINSNDLYLGKCNYFDIEYNDTQLKKYNYTNVNDTYIVRNADDNSPVTILNRKKATEIQVSDYYFWSNNSKYFATHILMSSDNPEENHQPFENNYKTQIIFYDTSLTKNIIPGFGFSPCFIKNDNENIYYYNDISDSCNLIPPRIIKYNIKNKTRTVIFTFKNTYTFWTDPIDSIPYPPPLKYNNGIFEGQIYSKDSLELEDVKHFGINSEGKIIKFQRSTSESEESEFKNIEY